MKKIFIILFCFILFCSCNIPQKEIKEGIETDFSSNGNDYSLDADSKFEVTNESNLPPIENDYLLINSDNKMEVSKEFDLEIKESIITKMADHDDLQINLDLERKEDSIYFILLGSIKNNSSSSINLLELFKSSLVFDDNYQYDTYFSVDENNYELVPLKSMNFAIYASVPMEILTNANQYEYRILLPSKYKSIINADEIRLQGSVNQYGSPENVVNKHILAEMLENLVQSYPRILIFDSSDDRYRIYGSNSFSSDDDLSHAGKRFIYNRHEILLKSPKNSNEYWNSEFIIGTPSINYSYKDGYVSTRFIIQYEMYDSSLDKSYRLNAERTIIKSDNGSYENDNFSPTIIKMEDLPSLRNILQGNNLQFTKIHKDFETTVEINEPFRNTLLSLIEFYEKSAKFLPLKEE